MYAYTEPGDDVESYQRTVRGMQKLIKYFLFQFLSDFFMLLFLKHAKTCRVSAIEFETHKRLTVR